MKKRIAALLCALCAALLLALPAAAANEGIDTPAEHDDVMGVLLDGAPYMSFNATQTTVRFQVPASLQNKGALQVYDYRSGLKMMLNNVKDVTPDADGYVQITLPSTGEFCIAKVPFTDAYRLVLDLRYLDKSMWKSAKTPDKPFDTKKYVIPAGTWTTSKEWRAQQGLDPWPTVTDTSAAQEEPAPASSSAAPEQSASAAPESGAAQESAVESGTTESGTTESGFTSTNRTEDNGSAAVDFPDDGQPQPFPWGSYVVVAVSAALGILLANLFRSH